MSKSLVYSVTLDLTIPEILGLIAARLTVAGIPFLNNHNPPSIIVPLDNGVNLTEVLGSLSSITRITYFMRDEVDQALLPSLKDVFGGNEYAEISIDTIAPSELFIKNRRSLSRS